MMLAKLGKKVNDGVKLVSNVLFTNSRIYADPVDLKQFMDSMLIFGNTPMV